MRHAVSAYIISSGPVSYSKISPMMMAMILNRQFNVLRTRLLLLFVIMLLPISDSANDTLEVPAGVNCVCPGDVLTYTCNVIGGGTTIWGGSAFDCSSTSNEIFLRHSQFSTPGTSGSCNNGAIRARSIGVTDGCYTSELSVTVSSSLNNKTIRCSHDSDMGTRIVDTSMLPTIMSALEPPSTVQLVDVRDGQVLLNWTSVVSTCVPAYYRITSNCSTCNPEATNLTTDGCSIPQSVGVCVYSVESVVCGNLVGSPSRPVVVTLQVPTVSVIPHYSSVDNTLTKFTILGINLMIAKSGSRAIFIMEYNITFSEPDTDNVIHSTTVSTCGEDTCETDITLPSSTLVCPPSTFTVDVSADHGYGQTLLSDPINTECTNKFVDVQYNSDASTISCIFSNLMDTSIKSCHVSYGPCGQRQTQSAQGNTSLTFPNSVTLTIMHHGSYCYTVTASSGNVTVAIDGMMQSNSEGSNLDVIIVGVVVACLFIIVLIVVLIIAIVMMTVIIPRRRRYALKNIRLREIMQSVEERLKLKPIQGRSFEKLDIPKSCKLREAIVDDHSKTFKRGRVYYEFVHKKENISEDKSNEIIFMTKDTEYLSPNVDPDTLYEEKLLGEGVRKPKYENYKVFVQSTGSGARHLPAGSMLLYEQVKAKPWKPENAPLQPVISNHFMTSTVTSECTVDEFRKEKNLEANKANVFIEFGDPIIKDIRDVILEDKKTGKLFTGPTARSKPSEYLEKYRVFVVGKKFDTNLKLQRGKIVLHQNPNYTSQQFYVLEVDEDNVQMANLVEKKLKVKFENGRAFYEFTQTEEDLLFYKDVVRMPKKQDGVKVSEKQDEAKVNKKQDGIKVNEKPDGTKVDGKQDRAKIDEKQGGAKINDKDEIKKQNGGKVNEKQNGAKKINGKQDGVQVNDKQDGVKVNKKHEEKIFDLDSSIKRFYWLSESVPGIRIQPPNFKDYRVFVQSTSQGSRCLKARTLLLYKV